MLGNRGFGLDSGCLLTNFLFFNLVEKNLLMVKKFSNVAKLTSTIYETDNCHDAASGNWEPVIILEIEICAHTERW